MPKNIAIFSDGTGNSAIKGRGTNVFKFYEAVDLNSHQLKPPFTPQVAIYDDGVGTEKWKPLKILGGAFGWGLSRNVRQLYGDLARVYEPGDSIFVFGFSRGAFTVRTLAGFITSCGLLDVSKCQHDAEISYWVKKAYSRYRHKYRSLFGFLHSLFSRLLGKAWDTTDRFHQSVPIHFIGVWDTVDAVGLPFDEAVDALNLIYRFRFSDNKLNGLVEKACHAIAIDDERRTFSPVLWDEAEEDEKEQRIEQVWFAGVHSNVGGGYPRQGMSLVSLDWMMTRAEEAGLRILARERDLYRERQNVNDKLYNSRSGFSVYYRYRPRDIAQISRESHTSPKIHISAVERIVQGTEGYSPGNIPSTLEIVSTGPPQMNYAEISQTIRDALKGDESLLKKHASLTRLRTLAYYGFLIFSLWAIVGPIYTEVQEANPETFLGNLKAIGISLGALFSWDGLKRMIGSLWDRPWVPVLGAISVAVGLFTRYKMHKVFSGFWYSLLPQMRKNL